MRDTFASLLYLDIRRLVHRVRLFVRDPKQLAIWGFIIALFVLLVIPYRMTPEEEAFDYSDGFVFGLELGPSLVLIVLGGLIWYSARRAPALFTASADGRFLIGSGLPPRHITLWLIARGILVHLLSFTPLIVFLFIFEPEGVHLPATAATYLLGLATVLSLRLPIFVAAERWSPAPFIGLGIVLIVAGLTLAGQTLVSVVQSGGPIAAGIAQYAPSFPPGSWIIGAVGGDGLSMLALLGCALVTITATIVAAGDALPEVWQSSKTHFMLRAAVKEGGGIAAIKLQRKLKRQREAAARSQAQQERYGHEAERGDEGRSARSGRTGQSDRPNLWGWGPLRGIRVPGGAGVLLWKEWLAQARRTTWIPAPVWQTALALAVGAALGFADEFVPSDTLIGAVIGGGFSFFMIAAMAGNMQLAEDLAKPLWGLSAAPVRDRLAVQILSRVLLLTIPIGAGLTMLAIVRGQLALAIWPAPIMGAGLWALFSSSLALYSGMPAGGMMNPPMMFLRTLAGLVLLLPVIIITGVVVGLGTVAGLSSTNVLHLGAGTATLTAIIEGWLLIFLAAVRLRERGVEFALAEER